MSELPDKNVESVIKQLRSRMEAGYIKYQTTTERDDLSLIEWLQHLQEEIFDAAVYLERIKSDLQGETDERANLLP